MPGRPAKAINASSGAHTKEELKLRQETEDKLRGKTDSIQPFDYLSDDQKNIFNFLVKEMEASNILGNLDVYVLNNAAIAIDRLKTLEHQANIEPSVIFDKNFLSARKAYTDTFNKSCDSLCLSPTARAKIGSLTVQKTKADADPLIIALKKIKGGA